MNKPKMFLIIKDKSERVKNKNFRELGGYPLHEFFIKDKSDFDIYIDTDSERIFNEYNNNDKWPNVTVYMREQAHIDMENSGDISPAPYLIERFLKEYITDENETIVTSHITSPFLESRTILNALKEAQNFDSLSSVQEIKEFAVFGSPMNAVPINFSKDKIVKTQSLEPVRILNGAFFILRKKLFLNNGLRRISENHYYYTVSPYESIDIDTEFDFLLAQKIMELK